MIYKHIIMEKMPVMKKTNKLVLNVMDKNKYVLHISALKFYLQHGLRLKKSP